MVRADAGRRRDHPRSRGVYRHAEVHHRRVEGSSPLARGLRIVDKIKPALTRDHPRSRGVYPSPAAIATPAPGSSPLARGLRRPGSRSRGFVRIIPARAGFTVRGPLQRRSHEDHPRSRGVYAPPLQFPTVDAGSSPLARGLHPSVGRRRHHEGDHPRSRGVYGSQIHTWATMSGSSPLARGLLLLVNIAVCCIGIIPARAGFTRHHGWRRIHRPDHPRSRGVYRLTLRPGVRMSGSSPLARGLQRGNRPGRHPRRIIPARAGFTCP